MQSWAVEDGLGLLRELGVRRETSALLLVDMVRAYLDPALAHHPVDAAWAARIVATTEKLLGAVRRLGIPPLFVTNCSRKPGPLGLVDRRNPFWMWQAGRPIPGSTFKRDVGRIVEGAPVAEVHPAIRPLEGELIVNKRRYSAFFGTDLESILKGLGTKSLFVIGVNTNNCVLATCFAAQDRDYQVFVLEDCCGSMNGLDYHELALKQIKASIGWILTSEQFMAYCEATQA
jgi:nicotinamidase-related amidase